MGPYVFLVLTGLFITILVLAFKKWGFWKVLAGLALFGIAFGDSSDDREPGAYNTDHGSVFPDSD